MKACTEDSTLLQNVAQKMNERFGNCGIASTLEVLVDYKTKSKYDLERIFPTQLFNAELLKFLVQKTKQNNKVTMQEHDKMLWEGSIDFETLVSAVFEKEGKYYAMKLPTKSIDNFCQNVSKRKVHFIKIKLCANFKPSDNMRIVTVDVEDIDKEQNIISAKKMMEILSLQVHQDKVHKIYLQCGDDYYCIREKFFDDVHALAEHLRQIMRDKTKKQDAFIDNVLDLHGQKLQGEVQELLKFAIFKDLDSDITNQRLCKIACIWKPNSAFMQRVLNSSFENSTRIQVG